MWMTFQTSKYPENSQLLPMTSQFCDPVNHKNNYFLHLFIDCAICSACFLFFFVGFVYKIYFIETIKLWLCTTIKKNPFNIFLLLKKIIIQHSWKENNVYMYLYAKLVFSIITYNWFQEFWNKSFFIYVLIWQRVYSDSTLKLLMVQLHNGRMQMVVFFFSLENSSIYYLIISLRELRSASYCLMIMATSIKALSFVINDFNYLLCWFFIFFIIH